MLTFYALPVSTYCSKVRIALLLKNLPFREIPPPGGSYNSTAYHELVPAGSIPAIVHGELVLHDSSAIVEYLEELTLEPALLPSNSADKARIRALANFHDTRVEPAVRKFFPLLANEKPEALTINLAADSLVEQIHRLDKLIVNAPYSGGAKLTVADCAYPTTLNMMQKIFEHFCLDPRWPDKVSGLREAYAAHSIIQSEISKNDSALIDWIASKTGCLH